MTTTLSRPTEHVAEVVSQFNLARNLTMEQVRILCRHLEAISFQALEIVYRQGSPENSDLIILLSGHLDVVRELPSSQSPSSFVAKLGPGDAAGILGFVDGRPHSATGIATCSIEALALSRKTFAHLVQKHADIAIVLLKNLIVIAADIAYEMLDRHADAMLYMHGAYARSPLPDSYSKHS
ncbi:MAG TPA: cyclic nucleotide-binding domain-containing protein [Mariprofundaceae bacterium]|nr:cyclic nucleotide-binding domain-containing protein [Mariprofundaceae bacterium]